MAAVGDSIVAKQLQDVRELSPYYGWEFESVGDHRFRIALAAKNGDTYQIEVNYEGFPGQPPAFHWRDMQTGKLDQLISSPNPYNYFHGSGKICAPWNRLASGEGGPHQEWELASWQSNPYTKNTTTLAAMILRIQTELQSDKYQGHQQ